MKIADCVFRALFVLCCWTSAQENDEQNASEIEAEGSSMVEGPTYTHMWAVHLEGGPERAEELAQKHGFTYLGEVCLFHSFIIAP